jgi:transcriptional regulator with XRE-family HTH domain
MKNRNDVLKKALSDAGVSQQKLAEKLGVSRTSVTERLNGDKEIDSVDFISAVSEITGVPFVMLIAKKDDSYQMVEEPVANYNVKTMSIEELTKHMFDMEKKMAELERKLGKK